MGWQSFLDCLLSERRWRTLQSCVLFGTNNEVGKGQHEKAGMLVTSSLIKWKNALETSKDHLNRRIIKILSWHPKIFCVLHLNQIKIFFPNLNKKERKKVIKIVKFWFQLLRASYFVPRKNDPYEKSMTVDLFSWRGPKKDGKFCMLLRFRVKSGDKVLKKHLTEQKKMVLVLAQKFKIKSLTQLARSSWRK